MCYAGQRYSLINISEFLIECKYCIYDIRQALSAAQRLRCMLKTEWHIHSGYWRQIRIGRLDVLNCGPRHCH